MTSPPVTARDLEATTKPYLPDRGVRSTNRGVVVPAVILRGDLALTSRTGSHNFRFESHRFILNLQTRLKRPPSQFIADFARPDLARGVHLTTMGAGPGADSETVVAESKT